jgi:hypothetical protein
MRNMDILQIIPSVIRSKISPAIFYNIKNIWHEIATEKVELFTLIAIRKVMLF